VLVDVRKDNIFSPFGDARWKIEGEAAKGREMYFSTYQAIAKDERRPELYREFRPDFFDLVNALDKPLREIWEPVRFRPVLTSRKRQHRQQPHRATRREAGLMPRRVDCTKQRL
jgi:hypothetical protein